MQCATLIAPYAFAPSDDQSEVLRRIGVRAAIEALPGFAKKAGLAGGRSALAQAWNRSRTFHATNNKYRLSGPEFRNPASKQVLLM